MFNFAVAVKWQLFFRSFRMTTLMAFQIFQSPRRRGDTPVVSETLVTRFDHSPSPVGPDNTERTK